MENIILEEGMKAPDFILPGSDEKDHKLSDYLGKKVVLYFYPRDNTPGCSREAEAFRDNAEEFNKNNAVILGVSRDTIASHNKFIAKYDLPFILLSDPELDAIKKYDVWQEKKLYGKVSMGVVRTTYIIKDGIIDKVFNKVKAAENAKEVLEYLKG